MYKTIKVYSENDNIPDYTKYSLEEIDKMIAEEEEKMKKYRKEHKIIG